MGPELWRDMWDSFGEKIWGHIGLENWLRLQQLVHEPFTQLSELYDNP